MKQIPIYPIRLAFVASCIMLLSSCDRIVEVNIPQMPPSLVLHGYIAVGDTFRVALGKTIPENRAVPDTETYVHNGLVELYKNNQLIDTLHFNPSSLLYVSDKTIAVSGVSYSVRAEAPGFTSVEAQAKA